MKNLYKIENELYIISNTENVNENCWIITDDKLVQVSYLLSNEVVKGNKIILTTNKLLIKDGVQAIDDEFLEWFVQNPSCEEVKIEDYGTLYNFRYLILIPQEEPKDLAYWKENAEEDYMKVPISVLRYITELEERMYSEEDMIQFSAIAYLAMIDPTNNKSFEELLQTWLKQFKKKS